MDRQLKYHSQVIGADIVAKVEYQPSVGLIHSAFYLWNVYHAGFDILPYLKDKVKTDLENEAYRQFKGQS